MISFKHYGDFNKTFSFLNKNLNKNYVSIINRYGLEGVQALSAATPIDSGETATSWNYRVYYRKNGFTISWINTSQQDGIPIAILIQYGHGTRNGGYVQGLDFINPVMKPIFEKIAEDLWKEVIS